MSKKATTPNYDRMTPEALNAIRYMRQQGLSLREIAKAVPYSTKTIRLWLSRKSTDTKWKQRRASRLDIFKTEIEGIIVDSQKYGKQSLNYRGALRELRKRHPELDISYPAFCRFVREKCTVVKVETLSAIPLEHEPGEAQIDFFDAKYHKHGRLIDGHGFTVSFPYSDAKFLQVYPAENQECLFHALIKCFEFIGFVPRTVLFDNASTAIVKVEKSGRKVNPRYAEFAAHFGFDAQFCNPARGREKGSVERNNEVLRREYLSPPPTIDDEEAFNTAQLKTCFDTLSATTHYKKGVLKSELFAEDRRAGLPLPKAAFDECKTLRRKTNNCALVHVRGGEYSTSDKHANQWVTVRLGAFTVEIYDNYGEPIWTHPRSYQKGSTTIAQAAYIDAILARPRAKVAAGTEPKQEGEQSCLDKENDIIRTLLNTRKASRNEVLEDILETENMTITNPLATKSALFEIKPYTVNKEDYDIAIKGHR